MLWISPRGLSGVRIKYRTGGVWVSDTIPVNLYTHAPQIYAQNNDIYAFLGHDSQIRFGYQYHLSGQPWADYVPLTTLADGAIDGSASVRWDPPRDNNPNVIDAAFFDEDKLNDATTYLPQLYYMGVLPARPPAPGDTTPPTVSLTAPTAGVTVSGVVNATANAADDVGVAGVQFQVDGVNVGAEDKVAPYAASWDSTAVPNGSHTVSAIARDAAGNTSSPSSVVVSVSNAGAPRPSGLVAAYSFDAGAGTTLADVSGNGNSGVISGASWTAAGKYGGALSFNGSSSWVTVADASSLDLTNGMTLEAWVEPSALGGGWRAVVFKERPGGVVYSLYAHQGSAPVGQVYLGGEQNALGTAAAPVNMWTHLAVTFDGASLRLVCGRCSGADGGGGGLAGGLDGGVAAGRRLDLAGVVPGPDRRGADLQPRPHRLGDPNRHEHTGRLERCYPGSRPGTVAGP